MCDIVPGDIVVCVDASQCPCFTNTTRVRLRAVYRVTDVAMRQRLDGEHVAACRLDRDNPLKDGVEGWSASRRFKRLNDEPDKVDILEMIRACKPIGVPA